MYSVARTAALCGIGTVMVRVEADVSDGLPVFEMVGFLSSEVREARERVKTAVRNSGFSLPVKRITVNLYPADVKKSGTAYDLPVALALLSACGYVERERLEEVFVAGEVALDGRVLPVHGILPMVLDCGKEVKACIIPKENREEASLAEGVRLWPVESLEEAVALLNGKREPEEAFEPLETEGKEKGLDFSDLRGQKVLKRACEVAAAGMHNLLMIGSAGAGKSMAAKRMPTILPPMTKEERIELLRIESVAGTVTPEQAISMERPFRSPHHTITPQGMAGGGSGLVRPGEISLAHNGVLFLDELTEFAPAALEL
ncbi:MAG: ATP-binding protein, partial [Lachnospiraceae bacterium]|nr:ATP-binding protein [Lachnospiraceae bacterium]